MVNAPTASHSLTVRLQILNKPGMLGKVTSAIGKAGGDIGAHRPRRGRTGPRSSATSPFKASDERARPARSSSAMRGVDGVKVVNVSDRTFLMHLGGKIEVRGKMPVKTRDDLSMAYTPGVARVCMAIHDDPEKAYTLTIKQNTVAVVTDGTAVLGLGDIGPERRHAGHGRQGAALQGVRRRRRVAALPGHQGRRRDRDDRARRSRRCSAASTSRTSRRRAASRSRSGCSAELDIPVFHDDQHGTAVVVLAALINALKVVGKTMPDVRVVFTGAGAAGIADRQDPADGRGASTSSAATAQGAIYAGRHENMNSMKEWFAEAHEPARASRARPATRWRARTCSSACRGRGVVSLQGHQGDGAGRASSSPWPTRSRRSCRRRRRHRARDGHRPLRLPEPDQQLLLLPRHLPRHARRAGHAR